MDGFIAMVRKTTGEAWRKEREAFVASATHGFALVAEVNRQLESIRAHFAETLGRPVPSKYASTSVGNTRLLCDDLNILAVQLILRAKGLTQESLDEGEENEDGVFH